MYTQDKAVSKKILQRYEEAYNSEYRPAIRLKTLGKLLRRYTASHYQEQQNHAAPGVLTPKEIYILLKSTIRTTMILIDRAIKHKDKLISYYPSTIIIAGYGIADTARKPATKRYLLKVIKDFRVYHYRIDDKLTKLISKLQELESIESTSAEEVIPLAMNKEYLKDNVEEIFKVIYLLRNGLLTEPK